ncbi:MAG: sugar diacid recognition domain-containing protein [Sporomusaceae bacterium]|nr:sugar diacid recognition domain-containing protein [Sporomusaceae bacterium]
MLLSPLLAQQIVNKLLPLVHQNINIMNPRGIIIGSGQPDRINSLHKGAEQVIASAKPVEIYPHEIDRYNGAKPGLNMPIIINRQMIGVVGVSGHPDAVRSVALMVKMITELIIEQELLQEEARSQSQLRENFALQLLSPEASLNTDKIVKMAKLLKFDLSLPRCVLVSDMQNLLPGALETTNLAEFALARSKEALLLQLTDAALLRSEDFAVFLETKLLILKHFSQEKSLQHRQEWAQAVRNVLSPDKALAFPLGLGSLLNSSNKLAQSYEEALFALSRKQPLATIHDLDILADYVTTTLAANPPQPLDQLRRQIEQELDRKYNMKQTLSYLLANNLSLTDTAKTLFIHRNTLLFRLEKLKEATGLDPCHFLNHALLCKVILHS